MDAHAASCFHCAAKLDAVRPVLLEVQGTQHAFCCGGCAAAAQWISNAGLSDYYRWRDRAPAVDVALRSDEEPWDVPEFLERHAPLVDGAREIVLLLDGMHCAACAWLIDRALARQPGIVSATAAFATRRLRLRFDPARTRLSSAMQTLDRLGYRAHLAGSAAAERSRVRSARTELMRVGLAGLCAMQAMMFSEALYFGAEMDPAVRDAFRWLAFSTSVPAIAWSALPIYRGAWREWRLRRLGMDTPVALSIALAFGASTWATLTHGAEVWFDAAVMFVFLVLASRLLESRLRRRSPDAGEVLARAQPEYVERVDASGAVATIAVTALAAGDRVRVRAGDALAADGRLVEGTAEVDESLLSGEPHAVLKRTGDTLYAGSICVGTPLLLRVERCGAATLICDLRRLVERAASERPSIARLSERAAAVFVGAVLLAAVATALYWGPTNPARAISATLAVLVVSCPCALALAIPAALAAAHSRLAQMGVLVLRADALERLARVDRVLLDKTGTLTWGKPALRSTRSWHGLAAAPARAIAAALERGSRHPIARAFAPYDDGRAATALREHAGAGVEGIVGGTHYRLGNAGFAGAALGDDDDGALCLSDASGLLARFRIDDPPRADARRACAAMLAQGLALEVLSGDAAPNVAPLCAVLGIDAFHAGQTPADKLDRLRQLQGQGVRVAMVGDGINDAPVLAGADLAIALGCGAALAHRAADLVILGERLAPLPQAIAGAHRARAVMRQNLLWALVYNLGAIPFAAAGWVPPWLAALGMTASSLLVTLNAARLALPNRSVERTNDVATDAMSSVPPLAATR